MQPPDHTSARRAFALCQSQRRAKIAWKRNDRDAAKKLWDDAIARCELIVKQLGGSARAARLLERIRDKRMREAGPSQ
jgi:hypothetical protein